MEDTDPRSAFESFVKAAECGNADAICRLGCAYDPLDGDELGLKEDKEKSFHYFDMAISKGHAGAMFQRGFDLVEHQVL